MAIAPCLGCILGGSDHINICNIRKPIFLITEQLKILILTLGALR